MTTLNSLRKICIEHCITVNDSIAVSYIYNTITDTMEEDLLDLTSTTVFDLYVWLGYDMAS